MKRTLCQVEKIFFFLNVVPTNPVLTTKVVKACLKVESLSKHVLNIKLSEVTWQLQSF